MKDDPQAAVDTLRRAMTEDFRPGIEARRRQIRADATEQNAEVKLALWDRYECILETFSTAGLNGADESLRKELEQISSYILPQEVPNARALAKDSGYDQILENEAHYDHYQITDVVDGAAGRRRGRTVELSAIDAYRLHRQGKSDPEIHDELCTLPNGHKGARADESREHCIDSFRKGYEKIARLLKPARK